MEREQLGVIALDARSIVVVSPRQVSSQLVGGEAAILDLDRGVYYGLDEIGARIWNLAQAPTSVDALCEVLVREYDVDRERCERSVVTLLGELVAKGLVEIVAVA